jgi:LAO/AO transport system kinase
MKAGIMEIADVFVVNKSDREGAERVVTEVNMMLDLMTDRAWRPPIASTIAERGEGIVGLCDKIEEHKKHLEETEEGRKRKFYRLKIEVEEILSREIARIVERAWEEERTTELLENLADRKTDPYTIAGSLIDKILGRD